MTTRQKAAMLAFTGTEVTKPQLIESLERHAAADRRVTDHARLEACTSRVSPPLESQQ